MKKINKQLPVNILEALKKFMNSLDSKQASLFCISDSKEFLLLLEDLDKTSGFYFRIEKFDYSHGLLINYKPESKSKTTNRTTFAKPEDLPVFFKIWSDCLVAYAELEKFYQDPFLTNLENEFLSDFDLISEENQNEPLSLKQIYFLEEFLSTIEERIDDYRTEHNSQEIDSISSETNYLKSQLGKQTKEWIAKKIASILAKITQEGPGILKSIFKEGGKQLVSQGVKFLLEHGDKLIA